jgi:hypothetical protein
LIAHRVNAQVVCSSLRFVRFHTTSNALDVTFVKYIVLFIVIVLDFIVITLVYEMSDD